MIFMIKAISNLTNHNTMHTTHVQAPTPAHRTTIFSRTRSLLRRTLVLALLTFLFGGQRTWGQNYVFYNSTYGYIVNNNGNPGVSTTFTKSAIWVANNTLGTTSRNVKSYTDNSKYFRGTAGDRWGTKGTFTLGNSENQWQLRGSSNLNRANSTYGYVRYDGSAFYLQASDASTNFTGAAITISNSTPSNPTISITAASGLTNGGIQLTGNITGTYTPSYSYATVRNYNNSNSQTYYWTTTTEATTTDPSITSWGDATKTWAVTTGGTYASVNSDGLITITGNPTGNIVITLTVSKGGYSGTQTFTLTRAQVSQNITTSTEISNPTVSPASTALYYNQYT